MRLGIRVATAAISMLLCATQSLAAVSLPPDTPQSIVMPQTALVTGNGFGFAVASPLTADITKFYAHPYRFERPNEDVTQDGYPTANFIKRISWSKNPEPHGSREIEYLRESQIISAHGESDTNYAFLPFSLHRNALILMKQPNTVASIIDPTLFVEWLHPIEKDQQVQVAGKRVRLIKFKDVKETVAIVSLDLAGKEVATGNVMKGAAWAFLSVEDDLSLQATIQDFANWQKNYYGKALLDRELKEVEAWRAPQKVTFSSLKERRLWRQNEIFLRMAQIQEPNLPALRYSHGLILASLPDGVWFTPWVRDMAYSVVALIRMGHLAEAREAILAYFNARPVAKWRHETRGLDYQISVVRYFGDGSEEADYSGLETPNIEFDDWGLALWTVAEYWDQTKDEAFLKSETYRGRLYDSMRDYVVQPLLGNLDPYSDGLIVAEDSSLWEEHQQNKRHYAFSTIAAINGLKGFLPIAKAMHDDLTVQLVTEKLEQLEKGLKAAFVKDGVLRGSLEPSFKNEIDGSGLEAFNFGVLNDPTLINNTVQKMELLKTASGGYRRVRGTSNYEKQEFLFIDFNLARVLLRQNQPKAAADILDVLVDKSVKDHGLIPEMYVSEKCSDYPGAIGDPCGATPMVGYGAGIYAITLFDRENFARKNALRPMQKN